MEASLHLERIIFFLVPRSTSNVSKYLALGPPDIWFARSLTKKHTFDAITLACFMALKVVYKYVCVCFSFGVSTKDLEIVRRLNADQPSTHTTNKRTTNTHKWRVQHRIIRQQSVFNLYNAGSDASESIWSWVWCEYMVAIYEIICPKHRASLTQAPLKLHIYIYLN